MTARLLLALAMLVAPASADTWIVGHGTGVDFTDLQAAIDTVDPGDTLLIRGTQRARTSFSVPPFTVTKSLTIRGAGPSATIQGGTAEQGADATRSRDRRGRRFEHRDRESARGGWARRGVGMNGADGIRVLSCGSLAVARCTVLAGENWSRSGDWHPDLQEGIDARGTTHLVLRDSIVHGGEGSYSDGWVGVPATPSDGGAGVLLGGASALIDRCEIVGGAGGDCVVRIPFAERHPWPPSTHGANGGAGIDAGDCPEVLVLGGTSVGGARGEYLLERWNPDTWIGQLGFEEGSDRPAIDGDVRRGSG